MTTPALITALRALLERYVDLVNSGGCGNWNPEREDQVIAARAAIVAAAEAELVAQQMPTRMDFVPPKVSSGSISSCGCSSMTDGFGKTTEWKCAAHATPQAQPPKEIEALMKLATRLEEGADDQGQGVVQEAVDTLREVAVEKAKLRPNFRDRLITAFCSTYSASRKVAAGDILDWIMRLPWSEGETPHAQPQKEPALPCGAVCAGKVRDGLECSPGRCAVRDGGTAEKAEPTLPIEIYGRLYDVPVAVQVHIVALEMAAEKAGPPPIDMVLHCPVCFVQHIDAPEATEPIYGDEPIDDQQARWKHRWTNPPHRSHLCHSCGHIWRPADVPTNGVAAVKTAGKRDTLLIRRMR